MYNENVMGRLVKMSQNKRNNYSKSEIQEKWSQSQEMPIGQHQCCSQKLLLQYHSWKMGKIIQSTPRRRCSLTIKWCALPYVVCSPWSLKHVFSRMSLPYNAIIYWRIVNWRVALRCAYVPTRHLNFFNPVYRMCEQ